MKKMTLREEQNAVALATEALTQEMAEAYETLGTLKAFNFVQKMLTVGSLKKLKEIKESKKYKGLQFFNDGKLLTVGSWGQFCDACGLTRSKVDEDLQNLNQFGEDFLETSQRLGLGYREMRKLRRLPEGARAEIIEADYSETTDKEDLIEKIEDLTAQHAKEKAELSAKLKRATDDYEAQGRVLQNKTNQINQLDMKLAKQTKLIERMKPDEYGGALREEAAKISYSAEAILRGSVFKAFEALEKHTEAHPTIDHRQFMAGVLAEYQLIISELRQRFNLNEVPTGDNTPVWAVLDEAEEKYEHENDVADITKMLDEISDADIAE